MRHLSYMRRFGYYMRQNEFTLLYLFYNFATEMRKYP